MPFSVTMALINRLGVTSKAGFRALASYWRNSFSIKLNIQALHQRSRSSMGIKPPCASERSIVEVGTTE